MSSRTSAWLLLTLGCSAEHVEARAQTLLYIDTDAPLVGQLAQNPDLAGPIAIDTLRIDRLDDAGEPVETRELVAPDVRDWPISFGVVAQTPVRFRLRAFRADNASASEDGPLEPIRNLTVDRLIEVAAGATFERRLVLLDAGCFNAPASFSGNWATCLDADHLEARPSTGLEIVDTASATRAGTTLLAETEACPSDPPAFARCIPGGVGLLGDEGAALLATAITEHPAPSRAMYVSPFFLDETELSVGRYRALLESGEPLAERAATHAAGERARENCTYLGPDDATNDDLPLNCVSYEAARAVCQLAGGELPTEAQWEFAARGRGFAHLFPWGPAYPECCTASIERSALHGAPTQCDGFGIEPVGSHDGGDCAVVDASRDGVLDMAGSLSEWILDSYRGYDHACWATRGVPRDPHCQDEGASAHGMRGSYFNASFPTAVVVMRSQGAPGDTLGFRCAYPAGEER